MSDTRADLPSAPTATEPPGFRRAAGSLTSVLRTVAPPVAVILLIPQLFDTFRLTTLTTAAVFFITALGFNVVYGYAGIISFGHAAFSLIGAYTVALGQYHWQWSFTFSTIVAVVLCAAVAAVAALPTLRMAPFAIAVITLLYLPALNSSIQYYRSFTLGGDGVPVRPAALSGEQEWYLVAGLAALSWLGCRNLIRSPFGRAWQLTRDAPELAESLAIRPTAVRLGAVAISAGLAALAGATWPIGNGFTGPETFQLGYAILILVIVVIGGRATVNGPFAGSVVVAAITLGVSEVFTSGGTTSDILYAVVVLGVVLVAPGGALNLVHRVGAALSPRLRRPGADPNEATRQPAVRSIEDAIERMMPVTTGAILDVRAMAWSVGGVRILDGVDMTVRPGTVHGLIGPNGAGKTSLLNAVCGYLDPSAGDASIDGVVLRGTASRRSRTGLGRTFQHPALLEDESVLGNVLPGLDARQRATVLDYLLRLPRAGTRERATAAEARQWLEVVGLRGLEQAKASSLGPGQRRQLELARALATRPKVLLLDEPAAGLTVSELDVVERIVRAVADRGVAVVLIEHHFELVRRVCDEVTVMDAGTVIFQGHPAAAAHDHGVNEAYLGSPTGDVEARAAGAASAESDSDPCSAEGADAPAEPGAELHVRDLTAGYGFDVLHDVDLHVGRGEIVTLLGANGAGKSTLAMAIIGTVRPKRGSITLDGDDITGLGPAGVSTRGMAIVPEGRRVFARHTVEENLLVAAWPRRHDGVAVRADVDRLFERYPILGERRRAYAGSLSGGEAQILAIAMALVVRPRLVILDEPSLGLSPIAVLRMAEEIAALAAGGTSILLIEQNARMALDLAGRGYVLELGRVSVSGTAAELTADDSVRDAYLRV